MYRIYRNALPNAHFYLEYWKNKANEIPNKELREQALSSIKDKAFHCEGGAVYGLLAGEDSKKIIQFIVAYQTISDYLDNLCDRSTSLDEEDFRALHESMFHALTPGAMPINYYRYRSDQNDGGYLTELVQTCQSVLESLSGFISVQEAMKKLAQYYCDLQVYKHVEKDQRVNLLQSWYERNKYDLPDMTWYEFSACAGSTLGIFCFAAYASNGLMDEEQVKLIKEGYFPWVQGLHILLDYFIDQEEDRIEEDLNFIFYYENEDRMVERMKHVKQKAEESIRNLPNWKFHRLINKGLIAIYLADEKVQAQKEIKRLAKRFIRFGGLPTVFFYLNSWVYRRA